MQPGWISTLSLLAVGLLVLAAALVFLRPL